MSNDDTLFDRGFVPARVSRRTVLKGLGAAGLAAGLGGWRASGAVAARASGPGEDWGAFDAAVADAFESMGMVGAAVAVVSSDRVL